MSYKSHALGQHKAPLVSRSAFCCRWYEVLVFSKEVNLWKDLKVRHHLPAHGGRG